MIDTARTPPADVIAERHVLGLAIGAGHFPKLRAIVRAEHFFTPAHATLWRALEAMHAAGKPVELAAVAAELRATGQLGAVGQGGGTDADGADFLTMLVESYSFSTASCEHYSRLVRKNGRLRGINLTACRLAEAAFDPTADPDELLAEAAESLRAVEGPATLPHYVDAGEFLARPLTLADPIVAGLLRRGETGTLVSASKARKSWTALELLVDVATGGEWFGLRCRPGRGLLIDCELQPATLQARLNSLLRAKGLDAEAVRGRLMLTAWRGLTVTLAGLTAYLGAIQPGDFDLIIADPIYKLYPQGFDENSNAAMAELFGNFQALAERAGAALLLICHSPKGNTSDRTAIDLVSGAGSAGRAVDVAVALRAHAASEPGAPVIARETISRSFADLAPACFRWEHPRWIPAPELDPADLARAGGRKKKADKPDVPSKPIVEETEDFAGRFIGTEPKARVAIIDAAIQAGIAESRAGKLLGRAESRGLAHRWTFGAAKPVQFASVKQAQLAPVGQSGQAAGESKA